MFLYLMIGLNICACVETKTMEDTGRNVLPVCLDPSKDQTVLWERLGSPVRNMERDQFAPSLVADDSELRLYFAVRENLVDTVYVIVSQDGETWSEPNLVTGLDDFSEIKQLNILKRDDGFSAMIGGGRIGSAESIDGVDWSISGSQIIPTGDFDIYGQLYPAQYQNGDLLWYSGFNGSTFAIGMAKRMNDQWSHQGSVIQSISDDRYRNTAVAQSAIYEGSDSITMWYGGYDTSQTDPGPWRILTASSEDGERWSEHALALDLLDSGEEAWSVREPSVALWNDTLWMAYIAMGDDGKYRLRIASCSN